MEKREDSYVRKGLILYDEDNYEDAVKEFDKALFINQNHFMANYMKSLSLCRLGRHEDALPHLQISSESDENFLVQQQCNLILGYIYSKKNNIDTAISYFQKVVDAGLEASPAYNAMASLEYKKGEIKKAILHARKAVQLKNDNFNAMNTLGFILVDSGLDLKRGIKFIKKALEDDPDNAARLDSMGWAYLKMSNFELAQHFLAKAYEKAPFDDEINTHMRVLNDNL